MSKKRPSRQAITGKASQARQTRQTNQSSPPRNFVAKNMAQHRGGAHEKSAKAKRQQARQHLQHQLRTGKADAEFFMFVTA